MADRTENKRRYMASNPGSLRTEVDGGDQGTGATRGKVEQKGDGEQEGRQIPSHNGAVSSLFT